MINYGRIFCFFNGGCFFVGAVIGFGNGEKEMGDNLLKKLQIIMNDINVEILTSSPEPITLTSDTAI